MKKYIAEYFNGLELYNNDLVYIWAKSDWEADYMAKRYAFNYGLSLRGITLQG